MPVDDMVDSLLDEYQRRYTDRDAEGVTNLCVWPFVAIRKGEAIHLPDRDAVRDHFASAIQAYRFTEVVAWRRVETNTRQLGESSMFVSVNWNTLDTRRAGVAGQLDELSTAGNS